MYDVEGFGSYSTRRGTKVGMPGFSAEKSLTLTRSRYKTRTAWSYESSGWPIDYSIVPQLRAVLYSGCEECLWNTSMEGI